MQTRKDAVRQIKDDGAVILFPSGAISRAPKVIGQATESEWKTFAAKLAQSRHDHPAGVFQRSERISYMAARKMSQTLGYSLMFREIVRRIGTRVDVTIRKPISTADLAL